MNFTDTEVLLAQGFDRSIRQTVSGAQGLIDRKNGELKAAYDEIVLLRAALQNTRDQLRAETSARIAAEAELDHVLKLVDEMN